MLTTIKRLLFFPYQWIVYVPFLIISTLVMGSLAVIIATVFGPKIGSYCGVIWARMNSYVALMCVDMQGKEHIDPKQSYVIIANHQSYFDVFALYGWLGIDFRWVMKQELRRVPGLGIGCEKIGHIFIDRSSPAQALSTINSAKEKIANGTSVLFFPEGKRSKDGTMKDLKKGAFRFALDTGLPLLPITLINLYKIQPAGKLELHPGRGRCIIHEPINTKNYTDETMEQLMTESKKIIEDGLQK